MSVQGIFVPITSDAAFNLTKLESDLAKRTDLLDKLNESCSEHKYLDVVKEAKMLSLAGYTIKTKEENILKVYNIVKEDGKNVLLVNIDNRCLEVISHKDAVEALLEAHRATDHGTDEVTWSLFSTKYFMIWSEIVTFIYKNCNVCVARNDFAKSLPVKPYDPSKFTTFKALVLKMEPADDFKYVLCYIHKESKFKILRPLLKHSEVEIAMELLKIFLDFGAPYLLEVHETNFFRSVLTKIKIIVPGCDTKIKKIHQTYIEDNTADHLTSYNPSLKWPATCAAVQFQMNDASRNKFNGGYIKRLSYNFSKTKKKPQPSSNFLVSKDPSNSEQESIFCRICNFQMLTKFKCAECKTNVHHFCCEIMKLNENDSEDTINYKYICKICTILPKRMEVLSRLVEKTKELLQ